MKKLWNTINTVKLIILICVFILPIHAQQGDNTALNMVWHEADDEEYGRGYTLKVGFDIDEDGWGEMLVYERLNESSTVYKISLFEADADNSYTEVWYYQFDPADILCGERGLMVTDLDGDGFSEITAIMCTIDGVDNLYVWEWDGTDNGLPSTPTVTFDLPRDTGGRVALENNVQYLQMDDDANLEMVLTHRGGNSTFLQILELSNSDLDNPVWNVEFTDDWTGAKNSGFGITDIDHDGHKEIIMWNQDTGDVRVYENTGTDSYEVVNTWTPTPPDYVGATVKSLIPAVDFDMDGVDELYLSDSKGLLWVITPNGDVSTMFADANWHVLHDWKLDGYEYNEGGEVRGCIPGDLDRDGLPDLYFAGNDFGAIMDMEYEGGSVTDEESYSFYYTLIDGGTVEGGHFGRPANVDIGDMDNDGHLEIVAIVPWTGNNPVDNLRGLYVFEQSSSATNTHSLSFDGVDDYVEIPDNPNQSGMSELSIMTWVRFDSYPDYGNGNGGYMLFEKFQHVSANADRSYNLSTEWDYDALRFDLLLENGDAINLRFESFSSYLVLNQWHHIVGVYDGEYSHIYFDGNLVATSSSTATGNINDTSYPISIASSWGVVNPWDGDMDETSLWSVALTQSQIQSYMTTSLAGNETGLVGYWNFNEGTGNTLTDQSLNGNNGTIYGATWSTDVPFSGTSTTSALTWSVQAKASLGSYNDNDNYLGVASSATNTFDASYDVLEPPAPPGSSVRLYFPHAEWNSILGDNFSTDARPEIALTDTMQVWDFEVVSTDAGDATLTFVFSDVPSVPVILENTATGVRQTLTNNATYTFTAVADSAHPFRVSIGDTTAPALALGSSCTGPAILISDSTHSLGWTSTDGYEVDSVLVSFSSDSGTTYSLQAALGTVSGYSWTVPDAVVVTGGKFKIKAQDYAGNSTEKESDYVFAIAGDSLSAAVTAGWTLWGAPINPTNDTMTINLDDDFTDYWDTFDYVDNGYTYNGILKEAEGYWLGAAQSATIDVKGTPIVSDFTMSLSQGWELISNPLVLDVSVDSLTFTKDATTKTHAEAVTAGWVNSIYGYSSTGYAAATTFSPWSGYWIGVLETGVDMTFPIHRHDGSGSARSRENDWMITFDAQVDGANDGTTMIGYAETATDGFDAEHDAVQPPNPPGPDYVSLFIAHPEWNYPLGDKFAKDIRASVPDDEYKEWLLSIESSESDVQLNWTLMNIPDDYEVGYTIDDGIYFNDMRSVGTINISADTEIIVRVGSQVLGIDDETIPDVYALQQNYPNPFNPITTLRYDLPEQANVNIIIYDMLGRQVKSLINQTQDAGFKSVIWNATNDYGKPVSAGVYLYQIQAGEFVQTRKMVLLK